MITTEALAFYIVRASGEAAELIASIFSPGVMGDIRDVVVVSREFDNDIEPMNELDTSIVSLKKSLGCELVEDTTFNPLFIPLPIEELDDALEVEARNDNVKFSGMNGNPFTIKLIEISRGEDSLINASVSYQQFDLPAYETIMKNQLTLLLN